MGLAAHCTTARARARCGGARLLFVTEVLHLKWIWLSEWSCRRCERKNLECACPGRWVKYL
jgi:hypothetical protein